MPKALVLDFDGSVAGLGDTDTLDLRAHEEKIRYCAKFSDVRRLGERIRDAAQSNRIFFCGNGDFHHISYLLLRLLPARNLHVVVFDNHPDNMFFPYGIHCGSWVYHASRLPNVSFVTVIGITSSDIKGMNFIQNRLSTVRSGKVRYYCLVPVSKTAFHLGGQNMHYISNTQNLPETVSKLVEEIGSPVYLSVDKDVLSRSAALSTWDQGKMEEAELLRCIENIAPSVVAADIVGDISLYRYKSLLKRLLRRADGEDLPIGDIESERLKHQELNKKLLSLLSA